VRVHPVHARMLALSISNINVMAVDPSLPLVTKTG
jgi:hypothetical protein